MKILGSGHHSIVIATNDNCVEKFYNSQDEAEREKQNLSFLQEAIDEGLNIKSKIPKFMSGIEEGAWNIEGKIYELRSKMERIVGTPMHRLAADDDALGRNLGKIIALQHSQFKPFIEKWMSRHDGTDMLAKHIIRDKAEKIFRENSDSGEKEIVRKAVDYIRQETQDSWRQRTLSHLDLNQSNILVSKGIIEGLVDWGSFGLTHPSLTMYQLVSSPLWPAIRKEYESNAGIVDEKLLYAAATIHFAWAPLRYQELKLPFDEHQNRLNFEKFSTRFENL